MSKCVYRINLAVVALFAVCHPCAAQESDTRTSPEEYGARAKQLFTLLYPGLDVNLEVVIHWNRLTESHRMNNFWMELYQQPKPGAEVDRCWCSAPVLNAYFVFDWQTEQKELVLLAASGPAVTAQSDRFEQTLNAHPGWSDNEIIKALNEAGAKFGPNQQGEFLRSLQLKLLRPFVGELEVVSTEFQLRGTDPSHLVSPFWTVQAVWHGPKGQRKRCSFAFEPFEGKLTQLRREP
jgi:hypothetical protein